MRLSPWHSCLVLPTLGCLAALAFIDALGLDRAIAHALFWDASSGQWPARHAWWASELLHRGGRLFIILVAALTVVSLLLSRSTRRLHHWRRPLGYLLLALLLGWGGAAGIKQLSNVDCPWDLAEFGGDRPYVGLLQDRPDELPRARCYPGAHAASGFALLSFFFLLRERKPRHAHIALLAALGIGALFSVAQQARGAHFLSHDLSSAWLAWTASAWLYLGPFRGSLWQPDRQDSLN